MTIEEEKIIEPAAEPAEDFDVIQAIAELKQNSVSKDEYNRVVAENKRYLQALIDGNQLQEPLPEEVDVDALRKELFSTDNHMTNLEYVEKALKLRQAILDKDGIDIFVGEGSKYQATNEDYAAAERVAEAFKNCVEIADGDPEVFTRELTRITRPSSFDNKIKRR